MTEGIDSESPDPENNRLERINDGTYVLREVEAFCLKWLTREEQMDRGEEIRHIRAKVLDLIRE